MYVSGDDVLFAHDLSFYVTHASQAHCCCARRWVRGSGPPCPDGHIEAHAAMKPKEPSDEPISPEASRPGHSWQVIAACAGDPQSMTENAESEHFSRHDVARDFGCEAICSAAASPSVGANDGVAECVSDTHLCDATCAPSRYIYRYRGDTSARALPPGLGAFVGC